jgi:glutamate synthase (NADPH/NADH) large chain
MSAISPFARWSTAPRAQGLYDPAHDKDACGLAMVATLRGTPGHDIVEKALAALRNLEHRGAVGSDAGTGDGAGIITQIPDAFLREVIDFELPAKGAYAVGTAFLPAETQARSDEKLAIEKIAGQENLVVLGWREVPHKPEVVGDLARAAMPAFEQLFVRSAATNTKGQPLSGIELDRLTFRLRKRAERELGSYFPSLSCRTMVYKGMVTTLQLEPFYPDLSDPRFQSTLALVHSRYSTNTFPSWPLAQPFRMIAHNGEINTVRANRNWMRARQSQLSSEVLGDLSPLFPIISEGGSDSASLDEVVELLTLAGRSLPHAIMMMVPEAWENQVDMDESVRAFYEYHSMLMEPWDGPAALVFTDGSLVGATLDRNGLRPGRYVITSDGLIILASEIGVLDIDPSTVVRKGRLRPGSMLLADTLEGRLIEDQELKQQLAHQEPWAQWISDNRIELEKLPEREHISHTPASVMRRQRTFGYTEEEVRILLTPMGVGGAEPLGAMGSDTPIAAISDRPRMLFDYFTQQFAQVTNPPLDSIREEVVTSMSCGLGPERNLLASTPAHAAQVSLEFPVIDNDKLAKIEHLKLSSGQPATVVLSGLYRIDEGVQGLEGRLTALCEEVDVAVENGVTFIVLSDRDSTADLAPIPSLLMLSAVHHHLIRGEKRMQVGIVVEAGDVREVHHVALMIGFGASAVNPYLAMESVENLVNQGVIVGVDADTAVHNVIKALGKGVLKIMSKMGISTVASYAGAQAFEAIGLSEDFVAQYFTGTTTILGGVGLDIIASENEQRHRSAYPVTTVGNPHSRLSVGGEYQWRREGPPHLFNPETVFKLQHATRAKRFDVFREYTKTVDDQSERLMTLRGLFSLKTEGRTPVPLSEVESAGDIIRRFTTGAMSMGAISPEMHETLAVAMNELGARSNTGEGGESPERLRDPLRRSKIKQVASGRFGVTSFYLSMAEDLQIKMAQGAKPGEGGQLPSNKVYPWIAALRHGTPGVGLISPPPHHDIYSIEDLKQLIFDLKRSNPSARVHVKLVSQSGIGAVATGVAKAKADVVLISGHDGGTGASPLNSLKHAGTPWEIGLAEAQQTLVTNNLRGRVTVQVDGQMKTGRDVIIAALLGAEEYGFATAPMVVSGCILMRVCHLDTCPVGVATQNPVLRERFTGSPEFVKTFFEFLAEEVREYLAALGFRSLEEAVGQVHLLDVDRAIHHWKADGLDLSPILSTSHVSAGASLSRHEGQDHEIESHFDQQLIALCEPALARGEKVTLELPIRNTERAVGTMLGHTVTTLHGEHGLRAGTIDISLTGAAGQSLGAFLPGGITLRLSGDANDYVGKGLSGGSVIVRPPEGSLFPPERNVIAGNVIGYGATSGTLFISGVVGERFMVRNSGATAVVEGVGDHALEYMTGGLAVILGETGRNLGAGMSGGTAYVWKLRDERINREAILSGELEIGPLGSGDQEILLDLLRAHVEATSSPLATRMLADSRATIEEFVKVTPRDYQAVLRTRAQAEKEGLDPNGDVVWGRILEVTGG